MILYTYTVLKGTIFGEVCILSAFGTAASLKNLSQSPKLLWIGSEKDIERNNITSPTHSQSTYSLEKSIPKDESNNCDHEYLDDNKMERFDKNKSKVDRSNVTGGETFSAISDNNAVRTAGVNESVVVLQVHF